MKNVNMTVEGDELVIRIKLNERHGQSASGKSVTVATTAGNVVVPGFEQIKLGLNVYTKSR